MARKPQQARAISTVEAIIDASFICLVQQGLEGTTTNRIAEIAGVGVGSVYEYFDDKEAIFFAMTERFSKDIDILLKDCAKQITQLEVADTIRLMANRFSHLLLQNKGRYLALVRYILLADSRDFSEQVSKMLSDFAVQFILAKPQYAQLKNLQTMIYVFINAGIFNVMRNISTDNPPVSFEDMTEGLVTMVTSYVKTERNRVK